MDTKQTTLQLQGRRDVYIPSTHKICRHPQDRSVLGVVSNSAWRCPAAITPAGVAGVNTMLVSLSQNLWTNLSPPSCSSVETHRCTCIHSFIACAYYWKRYSCHRPVSPQEVLNPCGRFLEMNTKLIATLPSRLARVKLDVSVEELK